MGVTTQTVGYHIGIEQLEIGHIIIFLAKKLTIAIGCLTPHHGRGCQADIRLDSHLGQQEPLAFLHAEGITLMTIVALKGQLCEWFQISLCHQGWILQCLADGMTPE